MVNGAFGAPFLHVPLAACGVFIDDLVPGF